MLDVLRLLLVHAHPDDETLTHGATIAAALAHGHEVDLVTCTRGEEGEVIGEADRHRTSDRDDTLAELRVAELDRALRALSAGSSAAVRHTYLDDLPPVPGSSRPWPRYRDSGMVVAPGGRAEVPADVRPECFAVARLDEAAGRLADLVRRRRPHVLLTYGPHGGYGHPDHVMAHRVAVRALVLAAGAGPDAWSVPWRYGAAGDAGELRTWLRQRADPSAWDPDGPLPHLFVPAEQLDAVVRAGAWLGTKAAALRELPSQVTVLDDRPGHGVLALSNDVPQPLTGTEHGQLLHPVGPCTEVPLLAADDPLAGLLLPVGTRPAAAPAG